MTSVRVAVRTALVLTAAIAVPHQARAQGTDVAAWASVGLGGGESMSGIAGVLRENVSLGRFQLTARQSDVGPFMGSGPGIRDNGVLLGMRTGGHRLFGSAALGYTSATAYRQCDQCGYVTTESAVGALAYDVAIHANAYVPGLAAAFSGAIGPKHVASSAFTVNVELGWFGR